MPPKPAPPPPSQSLCELIKQYLTIDTCSASTAALLAETLASKSTPSATATSKARNSRPVATKPTARSRPQPTDGLSITERSRLAVEVINGSLRGLSGTPTNTTKREAVPASKARTTSRLASAGSKVLQSRSENSGDISIPNLDAVDHLANCCSTSISFLISTESAEGAPSMQPLQTENARLSLSTKLIQLGRFETAMDELKLLKRRLQLVMNGGSGVESWLVELKTEDPVAKKTAGRVPTRPNISEADAKTEGEELSTLLEFPQVSTSSSAFILVISYQLAILRCIAGLKRPEMTETILPSLTAQSSPLNLIKSFARSSASKALAHISTLAQLLVSLTPSSLATFDSVALQSCSPRAAVILQTLYIECLSIQQIMRPEDKPTNLWDIFAKYLGTYIRRAPAQDSKGKRDRYVLARDLVEKMKRRLNHTDSAEALPLEVYRLMSWAASDANIARDSVRWTEEWLLVLEKSDNKANAALMVLCKVRLSVLELKALRVAQVGKMVPGIDKLDFLEQKIAMMAEGLDNVSRGRKQDLEALLQEVGQLRRNALGLLTSLPHDGRKFGDSSDGDGSTRDAERKLRVLCDKAFRGVLRFCRKYMTMGIAEEEYTRLQAILTPAVDTVLSACLWGFSVEYSDAWENAEALLSECWSAVKGAERDRPGSMDTFYDKLSSVYWSIFLLYRKAPGSESRAVRALRKSISALDDRPAEELIKATITRRWEILGNVYLSARDYRRAEEAFLLAIKNAAFTGQLNELGERATNGEPIRQIFDSSDREAATIGAVLTGLVKIANKKQDRVASELRFEVEELSTSTRGCLLEWCFSLALDQMSEDGSLVRVIGERLIDVYEIEEMPIRRSRIISRLLELSVDHPGLLDSQEVRALGEECLEWANGVSASDLDEDKNLEGFRDDILARCCVGLGFSGWLDGNPRTDLFWTAFQLWDAIVKNEADWEKLSCRVDSLDEAIKRLDMMVEFFDMKGESELRLASLELLLELRKIEIPVNYNALISVYTTLGLQYLRLGYSGKAGLSLGKAQAYLKKAEEDVTTATQLEWHLAYTEYLVGIGNLDKGLQYFDAANSIASKDDEFNSAKVSGARIAKRVFVNRVIADAAYVTSLIAFEKGNANESLLHARRCVRLNTRAWAGLENLSKDSIAQRSRAAELTENLQALSLSGPREHSTTHDALNSPKLWPLVSSLHLGYIQAANIYRHLGMIRESIYFAEQALKTVEAVDAKPAINRTKVMLGDLKIRCGQMEEGKELLMSVSSSMGTDKTAVLFQVAVGNFERLNGNFAAEIDAYQRAEKTIDSLVAKTLGKTAGAGEIQTELVEQMEQIRVAERPVTRRPRTPNTRPKTPTRGRADAAKAAAAKAAPEKQTTSVSGECTTLLKQKGDIQRLIARSLALQGECDAAAGTLKDAAKLPAGNQEIISQGLVEAINHLQKAFSLVSVDPVFSVLQESTISLPSIALSMDLAGGNVSPVKKTVRKVGVKKTKDFIAVLEQARDCLFKVHAKAMKSGSSTTIPKVASLLTSIIVLLSAMSSTAVASMSGRGPEHPLFASYSLELQKGLATQREKLVVETEKLGTSIKEDLHWPMLDFAPATAASIEAAPFEFSNFQSEYIDIIPKEWAAVSVTMSENRKELYITRFQAGQSQLMVRLPLNRNSSTDEYTEPIEYETAVSDFLAIIEESNNSTHQAKYMENKADRATWWNEREELDTRMKDLLEGIENSWLGGFKGIFSQYPKNPALFSRFKATFDKVLSKLPSRKRKRVGKVDIDYRILELFIALGNPDEDEELDEAVTDLIYFVVDILQFHGEGNAYDEIDIDPMVIAMKGALKSYHEEAALSPAEVEVEVDHTILILDKSVQMLPWESMPCLRGRSVSRLPSLAALRSRILQMQPSNMKLSRPGHYVKRTFGSYILNPDSDLKNTQKMFEADLKALPGQWAGIVNRAPSEAEFRDHLATKDVLLYFGHGSGGHYIPAKTIRKLDRCAVTCLMGCSSGTLKDAGEFEPYGMPTNFLLAGCPAILANLWDVTDKDIDKFTKDVFERWGLVGRGGGQGVSLVEAVARARDCCVMKYLNGAAPVVYGIPAYFG